MYITENIISCVHAFVIAYPCLYFSEILKRRPQLYFELDHKAMEQYYIKCTFFFMNFSKGFIKSPFTSRPPSALGYEEIAANCFLRLHKTGNKCLCVLF